MKKFVKQKVTILAIIIGLSATLMACSGGDAGMGSNNTSSITTLK